MKPRRTILLTGFLGLLSVAPALAQHADPDSARIEIGDVTRFLHVLDTLGAARTYNDSALVLFRDYYLPGSPGLRAFIRARISSPFELLDQMTSHHAYYAHLPRSLAALAAAQTEIRVALRRFKQLWPEARFADTYFLVGRMNSGGTTSRTAVLIGAEMYGRDADAPESELIPWERAVLRDLSMVPTIVLHEQMHVNQPGVQRPTLLMQALVEGGADFVAELVTGRNINEHVHAWADPREAALWEEFRAAMDGYDYTSWFGSSRPDRPADVGYWMGYRIARAYYLHASDKLRAIGDILHVSDADAFLAASGYPEATKQ